MTAIPLDVQVERLGAQLSALTKQLSTFEKNFVTRRPRPSLLTYVLAVIVVVLSVGLAFSAPEVLNAKNEAVCEAARDNRRLFVEIFAIFGGTKVIQDPVQRHKIEVLLSQDPPTC